MQEHELEQSLPIRELVEFILSSGSIDNRGASSDLYQRANEGARLHRKLQKLSREQYGDAYRSEVSLAADLSENGILYHLYGRADAVLTEGERMTVEEIKTTELPLERISGTPGEPGYRLLHWAQAKCYAYILCKQEPRSSIDVRLIYCQIETEQTVSFTQHFSVDELEAFCLDLLRRYHRWADYRWRWKQLRDEQARLLSFPFAAYRSGQRQMAAVIYRSAASGSRVLCQAPTGIGKTVSSLFPSVKAMGEGLISHLFYLTAKTSTRAVAEEGFDLMQQKGLRLKRVTLTAKDKICFLEERLCNPDDCPYARGYYDRAPDVLFTMLEQEDAFSRAVIERWARAEQLCPFELALDLSLWCDAVICDYNYLFDPVVYLRRFFDHPDSYCFLIDEAHNLLDRARSMYSAQLKKSEVLTCKKLGKSLAKPLSRSLNRLNQEMIALRKEILPQKEAGQEPYLIQAELPETLLQAARAFDTACSRFLEERRQDAAYRGVLAQVSESGDSPPAELLQLYFDVRFFLRIAELFDERFIFMVSASGSEVIVKLLCLDPAKMINNRLKLGRCVALFSATLSPPSYYKTVLGCADSSVSTHSYALPSPFPQENLCLLLCPQINTRWAARQASLEPIAHLLNRMISAKAGNYLAYFPSYQYLRQEAEVFSRLYPEVRLLLQTPEMSEEERQEFLRQYETPNRDSSLLGFAVLGGIYSEGIDFRGERLLGTAIIGTGLPKVGAQQEILRDYYQRQNGCGYDFAYRYPGMNKVLQAAGRVIRSSEDRGVVLLLDDRFSTADYNRLFPAHWGHARTVSDCEEMTLLLQQFWDTPEGSDR